MPSNIGVDVPSEEIRCVPKSCSWSSQFSSFLLPCSEEQFCRKEPGPGALASGIPSFCFSEEIQKVGLPAKWLTAFSEERVVLI
jgi:hypothetical protein